MSTVKPKIIATMLVFLLVLIFAAENCACASSVSRQIRLTITVVGRLSLDIEEDALADNSRLPEAEAFSELKSHGVLIDKVGRNNTKTWLFTKTE